MRITYKDGNTYNSLLDLLEAENVFIVRYRNESDTFSLQEICDACFSVELSPQELWHLGDELKRMAHHGRK